MGIREIKPLPSRSRQGCRVFQSERWSSICILTCFWMPCRPEQAGELTREVVSSLKDHLRQKEDELQMGWPGSGFADTHPMWNRTPWGRQVTSATIELAEVREAHWRALATTITLEEKIERLSQSITRDCPDGHDHSWCHDQQMRKSWGQSRRHHKALPESNPTHSPAHSPPQWEDEEAEPSFLEFDLGPPPELGADVECFFQELAGKCGEDGGSHLPTEPPAEEYEKWVEWRGWAIDTPSWWWELGKIPEVDDVQELAQKIWASFELPQWMSEVYDIENYYLAPLAPNSLCQKDFLLWWIQGSPTGTSRRNSWRRL